MRYSWGIIALFFVSTAYSASVSLAWDASTSEGITEYIIKYGAVPGVYTAQESAGMATSKTISGLPDGFRYYFVVTAKSPGGESDVSNEVSWRQAFTNPPTQILLEIGSASLENPFILTSDGMSTYAVSTNDDSGFCRFTFPVPYLDEYVIWSAVLSENEGTDSFYVSRDSQPEDIYDTVQLRAPIWQWTMINGRGGIDKPIESAHAIDPRLFIMSGTNEIRFRGREKGTGLKAILITNDRSVVPVYPSTPTNLTLTIER